MAFTLAPNRMSAARTGHTAIGTEDENLLLFGSDLGHTVELFDSTTESFSLAATLDSASASATLLANENILVLGQDLAGVFAPTRTNQWESLTSTNAVTLQRTGHTASELPSSKQILIAGGVNSSN